MGQQPNLLIVEDDTLHRIIYAKIAQKIGFRVFLAMSADEAIAAIGARDHACVLLDLMLGRGSGEDVLRAMAVASIKPDVILVSGAEEEVIADTVAFWARNGIQLRGPLRKPANVLELRALLESVMSARGENSADVSSLQQAPARSLSA